MPIRKSLSNADTDGPPSKIPRLNRKPKRAQLSAGPANNAVVVHGPTSPVMSEHGAIEAVSPVSAAVAVANPEIPPQSVSTANGSTTPNSMVTSANGAGLNPSIQAVKSPTFSDADTLLTDVDRSPGRSSSNSGIPNRFNSVQSSFYSPTETGSSYTSNTGGRARHSSFSPSSLTSIWRSNSNANANVSGTTSPQARDRESAATTQASDSKPTTLHHQSSPSAVTGPDQVPTSFFESDSDSDSDRYQSPILSQARASSIIRPSVVDHKANDNVIPQRSFAGVRTAANSPGPSMSKASQILGTDFKNLHQLTPALERNDPLRSHPLSSHPAVLVPGVHAARAASDFARGDSVVSAASVTGAHDFAKQAPPSPQLSFTPSSIVEGPPGDNEALDTLPSPLGGLGGLRVPPTFHSQNQHRALNGVGCAGGSVPKRTASAPPLRRTARIKTDDFVVKMGPGGKAFHRESVVSTPYPTRNSSVQDPDITMTGAISEAISRTSEGIATATGNAGFRTSFMKALPGRKEDVLLLRLSIARHPLLTHTIIVPVKSTSDGSSYDDAAFFAIIRKEYYGVIGPVRRFLTARTLASVAYHGPGSASIEGFDSVDFLQHVSNIKLGERRRKWVLWARKLAESTSGHAPYPTTPQPLSALPPGRSREDSVWDDIELSAMSTPALPFARLEFSHRSDIIKISLAVVAALVASIAAVILWTLLGLPRGANYGPGSIYGFRNSAARLETGLVFGMMVLLLGFASLMSWVAGSWVLL